MCGIAGYLGQSVLQRQERESSVHAMVGVLEHRGPDDTGIESDGPVTFGHRRLSIIDLSCAGHQPMMSHTGSLIMSYNGEVYNYRQLRAELEAEGSVFTSASDTEVVLEAITHWGDRAFRKFDGMFAIAIWNKETRTLTLARDRAGIKPLYIWTGKEGVLFASETKSIWRVLTHWGRAQVSERSLSDVVLMGSLYGSQTMFAEVTALRPGEVVTFDADGQKRSSTYFHTVAGDVDKGTYDELAAASDGALIDRLDNMLSQSVEMHLTSDAAVGVLCSGGVDSSLLTAMSVRSRPDLGIYHASFVGPGNEQEYAEMVAARLRTKLRIATMTREFYLDHMVRAVWHMDVPSYHANDISLYSVCKLAHEDGCKVLLSGEGADELFGGYSWHLNQVKSQSLTKRLHGIGRIHRRAAGVLQKLADSLSTSASTVPDRLWLVGAPVQSARSIASAAQGLSAMGARWNDWQLALGAYSFVGNADQSAVLAQMLANVAGHLDTILWRTDRLGMMASIENRVPILENDIIRFAVNLPLKAKIRRGQTKWLLKEVARRYLPAPVIDRPKAGFPVPWVSYLGNDLTRAWKGGFIADYFQMTPATIEAWIATDHALRWRLLNLEIWGRLFVRHEALDDVIAWFDQATTTSSAVRFA
jgi:asparagine synthase (glutamine-hydrolysing)